MMSRVLSLIFLCAMEISIAIAADGEHQDQTVTVSAQKNPDWSSYRAAYKVLEWHENYAKPKNFIRLTFQLSSEEKDLDYENLHLKLIGDRTNLELVLDERLQTTVPKLKEAYEDNAEFRVNRSAGTFRFKNIGSIKLNPDGLYPLKDLMVACDQLFNYLRDARTIFRIQTIGKKCVGVAFTYGGSIDSPVLMFRNEQDQMMPLNLFKSNRYGLGKYVEFRFPSSSVDGVVIARDLPVSINGIYE